MGRWIAIGVVGVLLGGGCAEKKVRPPDGDGGQGGSGGSGGHAGGSGGEGGSGGLGGSGAPTEYELVVVEAPLARDSAFPLRMTRDGTILGYAGPEQWAPTAYPVSVSSDGSFVPLDVPEHDRGFAHGGRGSLLVGEYQWKPQLWSSGVRLELQTADGWQSGVARDVGPDGSIAGSLADYDDPFEVRPGPRPYVWASGGPGGAPPARLELLVEGRDLGIAWAFGADGRIVGTLETESGLRAVVWPSRDEAPLLLPGAAGATPVEAFDVNADGDVAGRGLDRGQSVAFRYDASEQQTTFLPGLPGSDFTEAHGIGDGGQVVGVSAAGGQRHAVRWIEGAVTKLEDLVRTDAPAGADRLEAAVGIDGEGRIAVEVTRSDGRTAIGILIPAPR